MYNYNVGVAVRRSGIWPSILGMGSMGLGIGDDFLSVLVYTIYHELSSTFSIENDSYVSRSARWWSTSIHHRCGVTCLLSFRFIKLHVRRTSSIGVE
jgi:hypothetical protein